jgi:radical SAM superfamily enzyme YgiQ (UPF0313 family)
MMMNKSILLIAPPCLGSNVRVGEHLGIRYLCSYLLTHGYYADILESSLENTSLDDIINQINKYKIIGFSINYGGQYKSTRKIIDEYLNAGNFNQTNVDDKKIFIVGGQYATFQYKFILKDCSAIDYIILGEAEDILLQLLNQSFKQVGLIPNIAFKRKNKIFLSKKRLDKISVDIFPFPYRDKSSFFLGQKHFSMIASRGCYANCAFCSVSSFSKLTGRGKNWRLRSEGNVINELIDIKDKYDVSTISFLDSTFIGTDQKSIDRIDRFCKLLKQENININFSIECRANTVDEVLFRKLIKSGLKNVFVGLESGTEKGLKLFNKGISIQENQRAINILKRLGIDSQFGFINFFPEMELDDFMKNIEFLYKNVILTSKAFSSKLCIYHGTAYAKRDIPQVRLDDNNYEINYTFNDERINLLYSKVKEYAKLIAPYEIKLSKLIFYVNTTIMNKKIATKILKDIDKTRKLITDLIYYIAKYLYSKKENNHQTNSLKECDDFTLQTLSEIENHVSLINQKYERR